MCWYWLHRNVSLGQGPRLGRSPALKLGTPAVSVPRPNVWQQIVDSKFLYQGVLESKQKTDLCHVLSRLCETQSEWLDYQLKWFKSVKRLCKFSKECPIQKIRKAQSDWGSLKESHHGHLLIWAVAGSGLSIWVSMEHMLHTYTSYIKKHVATKKCFEVPSSKIFCHSTVCDGPEFPGICLSLPLLEALTWHFLMILAVVAESTPNL